MCPGAQAGRTCVHMCSQRTKRCTGLDRVMHVKSHLMISQGAAATNSLPDVVRPDSLTPDMKRARPWMQQWTAEVTQCAQGCASGVLLPVTSTGEPRFHIQLVARFGSAVWCDEIVE